ncbi:MAG: glycosyltransferase family 4 protein [Cyclobacteriaceae bacterium]|nr:glycosyltransferase family 4 protein [Cyclobacteriaceae bacterium]
MKNRKNSKTICLFNSTKSWGGGEFWHYLHAVSLSEAGYTLLVITNRKSELHDRIRSNKSIISEPLSINKLDFLNPLKVWKVRNIFIKHKVDFVIFNDSTDVKVGSIAAKWAGVSKIIYRRGLANIIKNSILNKMIFNYLITDFIANSQETKSTIVLNYPEVEDKIHVIYNGFPIDDFAKNNTSPLYAKKGDELVLGNAGRLTEQKGQIYLLQIARILKEKNINAKILIAGIGELEDSLKKQAIEMKVDDVVDFIGFVDDMKRFMQSIDIFVFPSLWEGFGYVLTEAMACKKPIIGFNITSNPELVEDGKNGYLVPVHDVNLLTEKIVELHNDKEKQMKMGKSGYDKLIHSFSLEKSVQKIESLI